MEMTRTSLTLGLLLSLFASLSLVAKSEHQGDKHQTLAGAYTGLAYVDGSIGDYFTAVFNADGTAFFFTSRGLNPNAPNSPATGTWKHICGDRYKINVNRIATTVTCGGEETNCGVSTPTSRETLKGEVTLNKRGEKAEGMVTLTFGYPLEDLKLKPVAGQPSIQLRLVMQRA